MPSIERAVSVTGRKPVDRNRAPAKDAKNKKKPMATVTKRYRTAAVTGHVYRRMVRPSPFSTC
jgi:hypothetical protein